MPRGGKREGSGPKPFLSENPDNLIEAHVRLFPHHAEFLRQQGAGSISLGIMKLCSKWVGLTPELAGDVEP